MKASELAQKAIDCATKYKTLYVMGCFGAPMTPSNKKRYTNNNAYNRRADRTAEINNASADTFGFDCNCLFKGLLFGWCGDASKVYGGAVYQSNGVPDATIKYFAEHCSDVSSDFSKVEAGEYLWNSDYSHAGICVGYVNGKLCKVESTPGWNDGVQLFEMSKGNTFAYHGKSCYVEYDTPQPQPQPQPSQPTITFPVTAVSLGCSGDYVKPVQIILKGLGFYTMDIDGSAGNGTRNAILKYQKASNGKLEVDGYFGQKCWEYFLGL